MYIWLAKVYKAFIKVIFKCNSIYLRLQNNQRISFQSEKAKLLDCLFNTEELDRCSCNESFLFYSQ